MFRQLNGLHQKLLASGFASHTPCTTVIHALFYSSLGTQEIKITSSMRDDPYPQFIVLVLNIIEDFQPQSYQKNPMPL